MFPIIRRIRNPLLPENPPLAPPPALPSSGNSQSATPDVKASTPSTPFQEIEERSDSVQSCSALSAASPTSINSVTINTAADTPPMGTKKSLPRNELMTPLPSADGCQTCPPSPSGSAFQDPDAAGPRAERCADSIQFCSVPSQSPPDTASQPLWFRQPDELATDYQLFVAWLQLPVPRPARKATAAALRCSVHLLNRIFTCHRWKIRTIAFDNHRANAASRALDELLQQETKDWHERARNYRLQEWLLHEQIMAAAMMALGDFERHARRASLHDLTRLLDLASILGRRATGMPLHPGGAKPEPPFPYLDAEACLRKIYGGESNSPARLKPVATAREGCAPQGHVASR